MMGSDQISYWDRASDELKKNVASMARGQERKIREIIGEEIWGPLSRTTRHRLGKHVRAHLDQYGLIFVRTSGTIAIYRKSEI